MSGSLGSRQLAVDHVQIGAADGAGRDPRQDLARPRRTVGQRAADEGPAGFLEDHREHGVIVLRKQPNGGCRSS